MNTETTRREILKLTGYGASASLLTPMLGQLAAHAAGDAKSANRKKVVFVLQCNGMNPAHLMPSGLERPKNGRPTNEKLEEESLKDRTLHAALEPLTPYKDRLALVQGLSGRIALSDHSANHGALGCYPANKGPMAQTIDCALGEANPGIFPYVALGMAEKPDQTLNYQLSAAGPGKANPVQCNPELAFKALFGSVAGGNNRAAFDRRTNLLDFMAEDVKRTRGQLAGEERQKFDQYLEAFENLRDRQAKIDAISDDLKKHAPKLDAKFAKPTETNRLEAQFEIAAASLITGLTNTVLLTSGGGGQHFPPFPELGIPVGGHHYGHGGGVPGKTYEDCFIAVRQYHCKLIANLAKTLECVKEGDGTMLDNTVIVYLSDSGDGHHPQLREWPVVLLGDLAGKLKTRGRYLQFPGYETKAHRTMANLYCTLLHAVGKPTDKFGVADPGLKDVNQSGVVAALLS
ncbi:MAG: DUF1552 domain-containing protein [Planctomycetes bacterium]|nr:DUF1552 domain-containing protein [Planctomycetota bacterium]